MRRALLAWPLASLLALGAACDLESPAEKGQKLFRSVTTGQSGAYPPYSCAYCHDVTPEPPDALRRPGMPMVNATHRTSFWGGERRTLRDASNLCITELMRGVALLPDSDDWFNLHAYLDSLSDPTAPAPVAVTMPRDCGICPTEGCDACVPEGQGDAARGELVYKAACRQCHGSLGGAGRMMENAAILSMGERHVVVACTKEDDPDNQPSHVAGKIRFGNFDLFGVPAAPEDECVQLPPGTIGHVSAVPNMPLFVKERLSPDELLDLLAYLFPGSP